MLISGPRRAIHLPLRDGYACPIDLHRDVCVVNLIGGASADACVEGT